MVKMSPECPLFNQFSKEKITGTSSPKSYEHTNMGNKKIIKRERAIKVKSNLNIQRH